MQNNIKHKINMRTNFLQVTNLLSINNQNES